MMASTSKAFPSALMAAIPFSPSSASTTSKPALVRIKRTDFRTSASSSTSSTLPSPMAPSFRHGEPLRGSRLIRAATSPTTRIRSCRPIPVAGICNPTTNLFPLVLNRKSESEGSPSPLLALHVDRTPVFRHDLVHDAQAQPRSLPRLLRREERVIDLVPHRLRYPRTSVRDLDDHVLAFDAGGQGEVAIALHRLRGVGYQVDEALVDLDPAGPEPRHVLKLRDDLHLPKFRTPPNHLDRLTQPLAQVDCNHFFLPVRPGVTSEVARDRGDVLGIADDVLGILHDLGLVVFVLDE